MEEFYLISLNLMYGDKDLNQKWANILLDAVTIPESSVLIDKKGGKSLEMKLARGDMGICAKSNSPSLELYAFKSEEEVKEVISKLTQTIITAARKIGIPFEKVGELKQYLQFSKKQLETDDPLIAGLWKIDNERKKSEK